MLGVLDRTKPTATTRPVRSEWWLLDRLALAWSVLSALGLYALVGRGGWYVDDFLNFGLARSYPLSGKYLLLPIFNHLQPASRLANWLLYRISPMNYQLAMALLCLGMGTATWLTYRILRLAFRPSPWHLVLTAMVSTTTMWVAPIAWWAAGGEIVGCVLASVLMTHAMLCCFRGRDRLLWGLLAGLWLLVGVAWYERAMFGAAFAAWFVPAVTCRSIRPSQLWAVLRRAWAGYLALLVVSVGYLSYYFSHHFVPVFRGYTRAELLHFYWVSWSHPLIPSLFGGPLNTGHYDIFSYAHPPLWWLTGCQVLLLVLVGYGLLRNRLRAALAWLVFVAIFLPAQYIVALYRLQMYHARSGQEFRYLADLLPLLVLTVGITILRPAMLLPATARPRAVLPDATEAAPTDTGQPADRLDRRHVLATGAALLALCVVYLVSALPVSHRWIADRHVDYVQNLRTSVAQLDRQGPWSMYTTYTPGDVSPAGYGHFSFTPVVAALVADRAVSADDLSKPMYVATPDGRLKPATLRPAATAPGRCASQPEMFMLPLSRPLPLGYWNLQLRYRAWVPTVLRFALDPGTGPLIEATGSYRSFTVSGSGQLTFLMRLTSIRALRLYLGAAGTCVSDVRIGIPTAIG